MLSPAALLTDVADGTLLAVTLPSGKRVCLARLGDEVCAFDDECPHAAFPLSAGELLGDGTVLCAWHGARFDARTGAVVEGPAPEALRVYPVRIADGGIYVGTDQTP